MITDSTTSEASDLFDEASRQAAENDLVAALASVCKALMTMRRAVGDEHPDIANILNLRGQIEMAQGEIAGARDCFARAVKIVESHERSPDVDRIYVQALTKLGHLEREPGDYVKAGSISRQSVEIRRCHVGDDHPDYAAEIGALTPILADQGKLDEAQQLYRQALTIFEATYGAEHYEVAVVIHNMAALAVQRGELARGEELYRRAVAVKSAVLGETHPDTALTMHNLAVLLMDRDQPREAERFCRRAIDVFERNLTDDHPSLQAAGQCLLEIRKSLDST